MDGVTIVFIIVDGGIQTKYVYMWDGFWSLFFNVLFVVFNVGQLSYSVKILQIHVHVYVIKF